MPQETFSEIIELRGHLIDSLILPKVLDEVLNLGGSFEILEISIGTRREEPSYARIRVSAPGEGELERILHRARQQGAEVEAEGDAVLEEAPRDGVFPHRVYVTTNLPTHIRWRGKWLEVVNPRMDCGIGVNPDEERAFTLSFSQVKKGDLIVVGHRGVRVTPYQRATPRQPFEFMASAVSVEKPKKAVIRQVAEEIRETQRQGKKVLLVAGPAVVHSGAGRALERMMELGYIDLFFSGNGLAVHDIEQALFGTSMGISLEEGIAVREGHENHIRAINTIREVGGIKAAIGKGILNKGILYTCIARGIDCLLAGSIRDDGPLPEVITDVVAAQEEMVKRVQGVGLALLVASSLHGIAVANILPGSVKVICVDIDPSVVTKLVDRGSFQTLGLVTDAAAFFHELLPYLEG